MELNTNPSFSPMLSSVRPTIGNQSVDQNRSCVPEDEALRVPLALLYSLIFLLGLLGNLLALWVFLFLHSRKNSVRVFLINMALADLVLLGCLPLRVLYHARGNEWPLGPRVCRLVGNLFYMNMYVSITLMGLIGLDRMLKLGGAGPGSGPGRCRIGTGRSRLTCALLWAGAVAALVPMVALPEGNEELGKCFQYKQRKHARGKAYFNLLMVCVFWLVFAVLMASYTRIALRLLRASRDKPDLPNASRYARAARKSFVVPLLFTVCFAPYHAFRGVYVLSQLRDASCETQRLMDRTNELVLLFSTLNSALDPLMYFALSGSVRRATLRALSRLLHTHIDTHTHSSSTELRRTSLTHNSSAAKVQSSPI